MFPSYDPGNVDHVVGARLIFYHYASVATDSHVFMIGPWSHLVEWTLGVARWSNNQHQRCILQETL